MHIYIHTHAHSSTHVLACRHTHSRFFCQTLLHTCTARPEKHTHTHTHTHTHSSTHVLACRRTHSRFFYSRPLRVSDALNICLRLPAGHLLQCPSATHTLSFSYCTAATSTQPPAHTHTHTHSDTHTQTVSVTQHSHTLHTCTHTHTQTVSVTNILTPCTHAHTHTHTHTHILSHNTLIVCATFSHPALIPWHTHKHTHTHNHDCHSLSQLQHAFPPKAHTLSHTLGQHNRCPASNEH